MSLEVVTLVGAGIGAATSLLAPLVAWMRERVTRTATKQRVTITISNKDGELMQVDTADLTLNEIKKKLGLTSTSINTKSERSAQADI